MPSKSNPAAPTCCSRPMIRNGKTTAGAVRWRCPICGKTATDGGGTHGGYRHGTKGGTTSTERSRKSRAKKKQENT